MNTNLIESSATAEQISEAHDWLADCGVRSGRLSDHRVIARVSQTYPGGWTAFVADCCTYVQL